MDFEKLVDQFRDQDTLSTLTIEQSTVFVDLLILAVLIDGEITETELEGLHTQWNQLPFAEDDALQDKLGAHGNATRERLETQLDDAAAMNTFIQETAARLEDESVKEAALRMVAVVSRTDGVASEEMELCDKLGKALGFDDARISSIVDEIYAAN